MKSVDSYRSPGPDGFSLGFYKSRWNIIAQEFVGLFSWLLNPPSFPSLIKDTLITLIPKRPCCTTPSDYMPISLTIVTYKTITKIIESRLKWLLPKMISPTQTVFVQGRNILGACIIF